MKRGFTLLELIIVIVVLGILASLAIPKYFQVIERARSTEGVQLLGLLRTAQLRMYAETAAFKACGDLDVEYTPPKFFTTNCYSGTTTDFNTQWVAQALRKGDVQLPAGFDAYTLEMRTDGQVKCTGTGCKFLGIQTAYP